MYNIIALFISSSFQGVAYNFSLEIPKKTPKFQHPEFPSNQKVRISTLKQNSVIKKMVKMSCEQFFQFFVKKNLDSKYSHMCI